MATTGRLSADQRTATLAGRAIRQRWDVLVPIASGSSTFITYPMDEGIFPRSDDEPARVIRAGGRKHEVWNPTPAVTNRPKAIRYTFDVDNNDGKFFGPNVNGFFTVPSVYTANPTECLIQHRIYVQTPSSIDHAWIWSELTHVKYIGEIIDVLYDDIADHSGDPQPAKATIVTEQLGASAALRRVWRKEDGVDVPMTQTNDATPFDFTWTVT